jgi:hypothetical protein
MKKSWEVIDLAEKSRDCQQAQKHPADLPLPMAFVCIS